MMFANPFQSAERRRARVIAHHRARQSEPLHAPRQPRAKRTKARMWIGAAVLLIGCAALFAANRARAAGFEIAVSPARFELSGKGSARLGQSLDIYNVGATATEVSVRTVDWTYSEDGKLGFHDELLPNSCRP